MFFDPCCCLINLDEKLLVGQVGLETQFQNTIIYFCCTFYAVDHLVKLYEDAKKQKCWDRFTRAQRKSIDNWLSTAKVRAFQCQHVFVTGNLKLNVYIHYLTSVYTLKITVQSILAVKQVNPLLN